AVQGFDEKTARQSGVPCTVHVWTVGTTKRIVHLDGTDMNGPVQFSPDGYSVATADSDLELRLWERSSGELRWRSAVHSALGMSRLAFAPDGRVLAVGYDNGTVGVRSTVSGQELTHFRTGQGTIESMSFSRDGERLAT